MTSLGRGASMLGSNLGVADGQTLVGPSSPWARESAKQASYPEGSAEAEERFVVRSDNASTTSAPSPSRAT